MEKSMIIRSKRGSELKPINGKLIGARKYLGLSQEKAANLIGLSYIGLYKIELLKCYPSKETQKNICSTYTKLGYPLSEEETFPEWMKEFRKKNRYAAQKRIPPEELVSLSSLSERVLPSQEPAALENICKKERSHVVSKVLATLSEREKTAITHWFLGEYTQREMASMFGVTYQRVSQIVKEGLEKLNRKGIKKILKEVYY